MHLKPLSQFLALFFLFTALISGVSAAGGSGAWMTKFDEAKQKAVDENRPILLYFTGSDWCPPCQYLDKNVLETAAFKGFAQKSLVLVELDFPMRKQQSADLRQQNQALSKEYKIEGYPTLIVLSPEGTVLDKTMGVAHPDPDKFIRHLQSVIQ